MRRSLRVLIVAVCTLAISVASFSQSVNDKASNQVEGITLQQPCPVMSTSYSASVTPVANHSYSWSLSGGTITGGQNMSTVTYTSGAAGTLMTLQLIDTPPVGPPVTTTAKLQVGFSDYPPSNFQSWNDPYYTGVCAIGRTSITAGCGTGLYCPSDSLNRAQMAVLLLKAEHSSSYVPPPCVGLFADVPCPSTYAAWVEQLYNEQITAGCGTNPLSYCPSSQVSRAQMSVFLLKLLYTPSYIPPTPCGCVFTDVHAADFAAAFIEKLSADQNVALLWCAPCGSSCSYFPNGSVTREQMAQFIALTFNLI